MTTAVPEGTAIVGAFGTGSVLYRRKGLTIDVSQSDGEDFRYNRVSFRAETRLGAAWLRPLSFCLITGI